MSIKKLNEEIQSIIVSSSKITNFMIAVEELVYNSLDAKSTSIAVRIDLLENNIQIVDNGCGITKKDFELLGQKFATSKYSNSFQFRAAPDMYGFSGQALSDIVHVSKTVKISSRSEYSEETWCKTFDAGKEYNLIRMNNTRPSKGTTVEVNGFLYNMNIQRKAIKPLQEINDIKTFLEQISLTNNNLSLTLRDNALNEIVFQMQKTKDIYKKIKIIFNIEHVDIQELQVEKNDFKCLAYIGKKCDEPTYTHWIFLNKRFVKDSKLKKLVQAYFTQHLKISSKVMRKQFKKNCDDRKIYMPFYIIFLSCPYHQYNINSKSKQSMLEFTNWDPVKLLLEKLIKFYVGDVNLKETKVQEKSNIFQQPIASSITEKVKEITKKILGNNSKKLVMSQVQNGIKGKLIKRRRKRSNKISITKVLPSQEVCNILNKDTNKITVPKYVKNKFKKSKQLDKSSSKKAYKTNIHKVLNQAQNSYINGDKIKEVENNDELSIRTQELKTNIKNKRNTFKKAIKRKADTPVNVEKQLDIVKKPTMHVPRKTAENAFYNRKLKQIAPNYKNHHRNSKNILLNNLIEDSIAQPKKPKQHFKLPFISSHDLLNTVLDKEQNPLFHNTRDKTKCIPYPVIDESLKNSLTTYESHHYETIKYRNISQTFNNNTLAKQFVIEKPLSPLNNKYEKTRFISKQSRENFNNTNSYQLSLIPYENRFESSLENHYCFKNTHMYREDVNKIDINDFPEKKYTYKNAKHSAKILYDNIIVHNETIITEEKDHTEVVEHNYSVISSPFACFTYTITSANTKITNGKNILDHNEHVKNISKEYRNGELSLTLTKYDQIDSIKKSHENIAFVSKSLEEPINLCEVILNSGDGLAFNFDNDIQLKTNTEHDTDNNLNASNPLENENILSQQNRSGSTHVSVQHELPFHNNIQINNHLDTRDVIKISSRDKFNDDNRNCDPVTESYYFSENIIESEKKHPYTSIFQSNQNHTENTYASVQHELPFDNNVQINRNCNVEDIIISCTSEMFHDDNKNCDRMTENYYFSENINESEKQHLNTNIFQLKGRFSFLPKGLSPIFENCNSKNICDYNFEEDYFETNLYNNFNNDVEANTGLFEARVQNTKDVTSKDIEKINTRMAKDKSTLTFSKHSLKEAKVLGQVDNKFIVTIMKGESDLGNYLLLFDQHAVHERIKLENNLTEYFDGNKWKSIHLDNIISIKLTKDEIMYLHNYKEKFCGFGLQWTILDDHEIKIHAIPLAILGQNPREVDKIIKTVKSFISEEIVNIMSQRGCVSKYPKSIMSLVNNEACRYSIMFGDTLTKKECVDLIASLSTCKTPFQCAHGRPVMAVVTRLKSETDTRKYQINLNNVLRFQENSKKKYK